MEERRRLGILGEEATAAEYRKRGYEILCANYRTRFGELDVVAFDGSNVCVCEVKTRTAGALVSGWEAVTVSKQKKIQAATLELVEKLSMTEYPVRFDVAVATPQGAFSMKIELLENAF